MKQQRSIQRSFLGTYTRVLVLIALGLLIVLSIRYLIPSTNGMMPVLGTSSPTEITSTSFQQWRETAEAAVIQTRSALISITTITPPPTCCPPTITPMPFTRGIFEAHIDPQPYGNFWQGVVNGQGMRVYAGGIAGTYSNTPNLTQGVIKVQVFAQDLSRHESLLVETSELTGWLEVVAENQFILTLVGQNGQTLYFDVRTLQFVDGLSGTVTAPTITPLLPVTTPTIPPTPYPLP